MLSITWETQFSEPYGQGHVTVVYSVAGARLSESSSPVSALRLRLRVGLQPRRRDPPAVTQTVIA